MIKYRIVSPDGSWYETLSIEEAKQLGDYIEIEFDIVAEEE